MSVRGDFRQLDNLVRGLRRLAAPKLRQSVNLQIAHAYLSRVQEGFETSTDPYGHKWKPLKSRKGQALADTGRLLGSLNVRATPWAATVASNVSYAGYHQRGTKRHGKTLIPKRAFLPDRGIPKSWRQEFEEIANEAVREALG